MTASRPQLRRTLYLGAAASALLSFGIPAGAEETGSGETVLQTPPTSYDIGPVQERQQYVLRLLMQVYDGRRDFSHTQLLGIGRVRQGDRSFTQFDFGDGAVVLTGDSGELAASRFMNLSPTEKGVLYDYRTKTVSGDGEIALFHNTVVRPLLGRAPELGRNAEWTAHLPLAGLGVPGAGTATAVVEMSREYFVHDGKPLVLIHYAIPAFTYVDGSGKTVVHWGSGLSLTDPGFGMIYLNSALHRAVARTDGGAGVPYRYARTMVAANPDGSAMLDYRTVPQLAPYIDEFFSKEAMQVVPTGERSLDDAPIEVARNLDLVALSIAEDGANEAPVAAGAQSSSNRGVEASTTATALRIQDMQQSDRMLRQISDQLAADAQRQQRQTNQIQQEASNKTDPDKQVGGPTGGDGPGGSLADEVSPETLAELEQSNQSGSGIDSMLNPSSDPTMAFGGEGTEIDPGNVVQQTGSVYGGIIGGDDGRVVGEQIGSYVDWMIEKYGAWDKFVAAGGGIAELQNDLAGLNQGFAALEDSVNRLGDMRNKATGLASDLMDTRNAIIKMEDTIGGFGGRALSSTELLEASQELSRLNDRAKTLTAEARVLDRQIGYLAQIKTQLPGLQKKIQAFATGVPDSRASRLIAGASQTLERLKLGPALSFLGGVGNIASVYQTASNLGQFDPSNPDLKLSGDYSSTGAMVSQLTLDVLGILGNAASGNIATTFADVSTFATGRFVDLYKVVKGAEQAGRQAEQAAMDAELTRKRAVNEIEDELERAILAGDQKRVDFLNKQLAKVATPDEVRAIYARMPSPSIIYTDEQTNDGGVSDPNWTDPRIDKATGLPNSQYWQYLKDKEPWKLIQLGIDPEAPVGGWPGGVGPEHRPPEFGKEPEIARTDPQSDPPVFDIKDGEDYPTAPPPTGGGGGTRTQRPGGGTTATVLTRAQKEAIEREQRREQAQKELDEYQAKKLAERDGDESNLPGSYELRTSNLETSELLTSSFEIEPVTFDRPTFKMPVFDEDGDLFVRNPDGTTSLKQVGPEDFKMTEFDPPDTSRFPPTDPNDKDGYPGTGEYPAFEYENMSGKEPDISKWAAWLATQDIRRLEQLAIGAGYPSLAFALADAENIIRLSLDSGFRSYANRGPNCAGTTGCTGSIGPWKRAWATVRLGDILAQSRGIFSTGGFSDVGISGFNLMYLLRDFGIQDGDLIDVEISQFGRMIFELRGHFLLNAGSKFNVNLRPGVAQMVITALNEGSASPNTAEIEIDSVVRGEARQTYSLDTGQTAVLRIEANARPGDAGSNGRMGTAAGGQNVIQRNVIRSEVPQIHTLKPGVTTLRRIEPQFQPAN